jgi:hypothetical protein
VGLFQKIFQDGAVAATVGALGHEEESVVAGRRHQTGAADGADVGIDAAVDADGRGGGGVGRAPAGPAQVAGGHAALPGALAGHPAPPPPVHRRGIRAPRGL